MENIQISIPITVSNLSLVSPADSSSHDSFTIRTSTSTKSQITIANLSPKSFLSDLTENMEETDFDFDFDSYESDTWSESKMYCISRKKSVCYPTTNLPKDKIPCKARASTLPRTKKVHFNDDVVYREHADWIKKIEEYRAMHKPRRLYSFRPFGKMV